jgi:hypothetical protein
MIVRMPDTPLDLDAIERDLIEVERAMDDMDASAAITGLTAGNETA